MKRICRRALLVAALAAGAGAALPCVAQEVTVQPVDGKGLKKAIEAQKGRVVVLNLWATWCTPCVEEFPDFVRLHKDYAAKGVTVLAVSMDEPGDRAKVEDFLQQQKASFPAFIRRGGDEFRFFAPVDRKWSGAIPTTYIFDRSGKRLGKPHPGAYTYDELVAAVTPALK